LPVRIAALTAIAAQLAGCSLTPHPTTEQQSPSEMPQALFAGAVAWLADSSTAILKNLIVVPGAKLTVEPRPLRTRPIEGVEIGQDTLWTDEAVDGLAPSELAAKLRVLHDAGFAPGDLNVFQQCLGDHVAEPGQTLPPDLWKPCPPSGTVVVAFGLLSATNAVANVEVLILYSTGERGEVSTSFTMHPEHGRWRLAKQKLWIVLG
jgi:hypothetical protein